MALSVSAIGDAERAITLCRDAYSRSNRVGDTFGAAEARHRHSWMLQGAGRHVEANQKSREALALAEANSYWALAAHAHYGLAQAALRAGSLDLASEHSDAAFGYYDRADNRDGIALHQVCMGDIATHASRLDDSIGHYRRAMVIFEALGQGRHRHVMETRLARVEIELGQPDAAEERLRRSLAVFGRVRDRTSAPRPNRWPSSTSSAGRST